MNDSLIGGKLSETGSTQFPSNHRRCRGSFTFPLGRKGVEAPDVKVSPHVVEVISSGSSRIGYYRES